MSFVDLLGRFATLTICRFGPPGALLTRDMGDARPGAPTLLLPGAEIPEGAAVGDQLEVFVYLDSEDRPIATLRTPKLSLGEVAFLAVTDVGKFGAFLDWGLAKELLLPHAEQTRDVQQGDRHPVGLYVDETARLAATMRIAELLSNGGGLPLDSWVEGEAWRNEPGLGVFVILERRFLGLLPAHEPNRLQRGEHAKFRIANLLPDGKVELSLRGHAHEELEADARRILEMLRAPGAIKLGDRLEPSAIVASVGLSKKAFKRAAGRLLKRGDVTLDKDGWLVPK